MPFNFIAGQHDPGLSRREPFRTCGRCSEWLNKGYFPDVYVRSTKYVFGKGAMDEAIIPGIGQQEGILITKDINISRRQIQFDLCKLHKIGIIFIRMPKGTDRHWEIVKLLVKHWEELMKCCHKYKPPFAFELTPKKGMERM